MSQSNTNCSMGHWRLSKRSLPYSFFLMLSFIGRILYTLSMLLFPLVDQMVNSLLSYNYIIIIQNRYQVHTKILFIKQCSIPRMYIIIGITDSSGIVFTYIDTPRQYDAGILFLGHAVAPVMIIPPNSNNFKTIGLCSDPCTTTV